MLVVESSSMSDEIMSYMILPYYTARQRCHPSMLRFVNLQLSVNTGQNDCGENDTP
jgi:hypothetical protein